MRTIYPVMLIICIGTAGLMWSMSGMGAIFGNDDPVDDLESTSEVEDRGDKLEEEDSDDDGGIFSVFRDPGSDSLVGAIISGGRQVLSFATLAVLLPFEFQRLGLPEWLAYPAGLSLQAVAFIGFIQFLTGRVYR